MTTTPITFSELAAQARSFFVTDTRDNGESFVKCASSAPQWVRDMARAAHDDMPPDDFKYECIAEALEAIADSGADTRDEMLGSEVDSEFADGKVAVYNFDRVQWLSSNLGRAAYCDEAASNGLASPDTDIYNRIGLGMYEEARQVFHAVVQALESREAEAE